MIDLTPTSTEYSGVSQNLLVGNAAIELDGDAEFQE